jgi:hypothetical protein
MAQHTPAALDRTLVGDAAAAAVDDDGHPPTKLLGGSAAASAHPSATARACAVADGTQALGEKALGEKALGALSCAVSPILPRSGVGAAGAPSPPTSTLLGAGALEARRSPLAEEPPRTSTPELRQRLVRPPRPSMRADHRQNRMQGLRFPYVSTHLGFGFCRDSKTSDAGTAIPLCFYPFGLWFLS